MFKQISIKREYLLVAISILLLFLCYQLAIKKTIMAYQAHKDFVTKLDNSSNLNYQPDYLQRKSRNLDELLKKYELDSMAFRGDVLVVIAALAQRENVKLINIPVPDPSYNLPAFELQRLDFEGDYFSLLRLYNQFYYKKDIGVIRSLRFKKIKSSPDAESKLVMEVLMERKK